MKNDKFLTNYHLDDYFRYLHSVATPPEAVPTELHNFFELYYFIAGDMVFYIEGKAYKLDSGDIMVINSDELHRASPLSAKPYERVVIHFNRRCLDGFSGEDYHILDFLTKRKVGQANLIESKKIDTAPLFAHLWKIEEAAKEKARHSAALIKTCFIQLLIEMNRIYAHKTDQIITPKHYDERIAAILKYINTNLSRKISLGRTRTQSLHQQILPLSYLQKEHRLSRFSSTSAINEL